MIHRFNFRTVADRHGKVIVFPLARAMYDYFALNGQRVRLELQTGKHVDGLVAAAADCRDGLLYRWCPIPRTHEEAELYVKSAAREMDNGTAVPFAILNGRDGSVIGATRFCQLEFWPWPDAHSRHGRRGMPDVCEISDTWLSQSAIRTGANAEAKLLMLGYAFEQWRVLRVCFHPDFRNERAIRSLAKLGATREGVLRTHRLGADDRPGSSVRFSILAEDWPAIKDRLAYRISRHADDLGAPAQRGGHSPGMMFG